MLHNERELFRQVVLLTAEETGINASIIEKDYYVSMYLKSLVNKEPQIVFKGGTSLSKCYGLIKRFSEDIDLNLECEKKPTESQRRHLKDNIVSTIEELGLELTNPDQIRSRRDYNKYIVDFSSVFGFASLKQYLIVETSVFLRAYPNKKLSASSIIYDFLKKEKREDMIALYALEPFVLNVQSMERTFIDKLFAIGDYYLTNRTVEHSRHIYDLYKLYAALEIDDSLRTLYQYVREDRMHHGNCLSAQPNVDLKALIQKIINENAYKNDYETITAGLLFESVSYEIAVSALQKIVDSGLLDG